jgi:hypothetical protein
METDSRTGEVEFAKRDDGRLELLYWTCRCHGYRYSFPGACLHTDQSNLIPPKQKLWGAFLQGKLCCTGSEMAMRNKVANEIRINDALDRGTLYGADRVVVLGWEAKPL